MQQVRSCCDGFLQLWREDKKTLLLVTHDVDESVFLSDRVVMMTSGPRARVGEIMDVTMPRPRERRTVLDDPQFYELRERLIASWKARPTIRRRRCPRPRRRRLQLGVRFAS